jgi:GNAT superfamily N-acetyltransferase
LSAAGLPAEGAPCGKHLVQSPAGQRIRVCDAETRLESIAMSLKFEIATVRNAAALATLHTAVAGHLTSLHGHGPWSAKTSEKGILYAMRTSRVFVVRDGNEIVATLRLTTKRPWAIDQSYFTTCQRPLYLLAMAVMPARQHKGIGRWSLEKAKQAAQKWKADVIRLDAYDADAGAGLFYANCGFTEMGRTSYRNAPLIYYEWLVPTKRTR